MLIVSWMNRLPTSLAKLRLDTPPCGEVPLPEAFFELLFVIELPGNESVLGLLGKPI